MIPEQFCYWLQGRAEMQPNNPPSAEEWKMIAAHLQLVFKKETRVNLDKMDRPVPPNPFDVLHVRRDDRDLQRVDLNKMITGQPIC
jgi:hypothetical protein